MTGQMLRTGFWDLGKIMNGKITCNECTNRRCFYRNVLTVVLSMSGCLCEHRFVVPGPSSGEFSSQSAELH